jgi:hypothetical protein
MPTVDSLAVSDRDFPADGGIEPCATTGTVMFASSAGIASRLALIGGMAFASSIGVELIACVTCPNVDVFGFFAGSFSVDFPRPATAVGSACHLPGTAEPFLSALCKVLAKSPCPVVWKGKTGLLSESDDAGSAWIMLVSTKPYFCNPVKCIRNTKGACFCLRVAKNQQLVETQGAIALCR